MGERDSGSKRQNRIWRDLQESSGLQRKGHIKETVRNGDWETGIKLRREMSKEKEIVTRVGEKDWGKK